MLLETDGYFSMLWALQITFHLLSFYWAGGRNVRHRNVCLKPKPLCGERPLAVPLKRKQKYTDIQKHTNTLYTNKHSQHH